jgi:hypothetical protein
VVAEAVEVLVEVAEVVEVLVEVVGVVEVPVKVLEDLVEILEGVWVDEAWAAMILCRPMAPNG